MNDGLKIKIGQMIMAGIPGERVSDGFSELCQKYRIGNFCISAENAYSLDTVCEINSQIRKITYDNMGIYPFISIDQEGGWVCRIHEGAAFMQGDMSHAAAGFDEGRMERVGSRLGRILRALGCNMDNAPVLDVNSLDGCPVIGTRSFGDDPERVAELGCGFMRGLNESGVCAVLKHFPGHGTSNGDTHLLTSRNDSDIDTLRKRDLHPFKRAFDEGGGAIMTAHITYKSFGDEPATATKSIMTELLRDELKFDGIAISDSMNMNAMHHAYPNGEGAVRAIEAGCDMLLYYPMNEEIFLPAIRAIYAAVESGRISEERINESYERIIKQKTRFKVDVCAPDLALARSLVYNENDVNEIFEEKLASVTCMKGKEILDTLIEKRILCISPICDAVRGVEESKRKILSFADDLCKELDNATPCISSLDGMTESVRCAIDGKYDVAVVGVFDAVSFPRQTEIINSLKEKGKTVVAVLLRSPYDYRFVKDCDAVITSYEYTALAVRATVKAMKNNDYRGILPIKTEL